MRVFPGVVISPIVTDRNNFYGVANWSVIRLITASLEFRRNYWIRKNEGMKENKDLRAR